MMDMPLEAYEAYAHHFVEQGWMVVPMADLEPVARARDAMLEMLRRELSSDLERLEDYHRFVGADDARHTDLQAKLTELFWQERFGYRICKAQLPFLQGFVGLDLHLQAYPYVRVARPGMKQDNIGVHRDTQYGATPYELSVWIPFVDVNADAALRVLPGSHLESEERFQWEQKPDPVVTKGSQKHKLGFPYAPKKLIGGGEQDMVPIPVRFGEMMIFSLSLIHGQTINDAPVTRFSSDIRIVNSLAPIAWERSVHKDFYEALSLSPVTEQAQAYYAAGSVAGAK